MRIGLLTSKSILLLFGFVFSTISVKPAHAQGASNSASEQAVTSGGPLRLRQPQPTSLPNPRRVDVPENAAQYRPGEFEQYIQRLTADDTVRRFGADLVIDGSAAQDVDPRVPADYRVAMGDELLVAIWGSVDADLRLVIDRSGRIAIPRIGSINVSGMTASEVAAAIDQQARKTFKQFELSVTIGQLRNVRVFVTGFAVRPGAYTANSLATLSSVLLTRAGGPSASGSFRDIELRRAGKTLARLDLYDLMLFGKRDADYLLQADDVIHIGPIGKQVALIGSVNKQAIFELRPGETLADVLRMGGGTNSVADQSRAAVERVSDRNDRRVRQISLPADIDTKLEGGDVVRFFSAIDTTQPTQRQNKRVRLEGEVVRPGVYILPPGSTVADALKLAGGITDQAFIFGAELNRDSVRQSQQLSYDRALRDIELEFSRRNVSTAARSSEEIINQNQQQIATDRLLSRLREARPTGRVVLQLDPAKQTLPDLVLEDGDRLYSPQRPMTVGVFGSVFNSGSYLHREQSTVEDYLRLAGSPTRGADVQSIFVIRANGSVISAQQYQNNWLSLGKKQIVSLPALPGDSVFVPEEANKSTFLQSAKDWTQVLYQLGVGLGAILAVTK